LRIFHIQRRASRYVDHVIFFGLMSRFIATPPG
jgi:hypothetical protein